MLDAIKLGARADAELGALQGLSIPDVLERLIETATAASGGNPEKAVSTLADALALLTASRNSNDVPRRCPPRGGLAPWQVKRVAAYVRDNIGTSVRASELATLVRLSYSHFSRAFKVSLDETPSSYIMRQRISLAQEKMLTTDHSLARVALECGLCDQAHFSRMFRRIVGLSPWQWRRQLACESPAKPKSRLAH